MNWFIFGLILLAMLNGVFVVEDPTRWLNWLSAIICLMAAYGASKE